MVMVRIAKAKIGSAAYKVIVDGEETLTLRTGSESLINLAAGRHKVYFKEDTLLGQKSNKLKVDVKPADNNIIIEGKPGILARGKLTASVLVGQIQIDYITVTCACGAPNKLIKGTSKVCEFCGRPVIG